MPDKSFSVGKIQGTHINSITVDISEGKNTGVSLLKETITQNTGGQFNLDIQVEMDIAYSKWHEKGEAWAIDPGTHDPFTYPFEGTYNDFSVKIGQVDFTVDLQFTVQSGKLIITVTDVGKPKASNVSSHLPDNSELSGNWSCVQDKIDESVNDQIISAIGDQKIADQIKENLQNLFSDIPNSGNLTDDITYLFAFQKIEYPGDQDIAIGVSGDISYKGDLYSNHATPPTLDLPPVIAGKDADFYIADFEFNGLCWAFYNENQLQFKITKNMLPDPSELTTDYYKDTPLHELYDKYPGCDMVVYVKALSAPTVATTTNGSDVKHDFDYNIFVLQNNQEIFIVEVEINEDDLLDQFSLSRLNDLQTLKFNFTLVDAEATLKKSIFPDWTPDAFQLIWKFMLRPIYSQELAKIGQTGVPLPFIQGFYFTNADIKCNDAFISTATDVIFESEKPEFTGKALTPKTWVEIRPQEKAKRPDLKSLLVKK